MTRSPRAFSGHQPRQQGVLVPSVAGEVHAAKERTVPVEGRNDGPGGVLRAVVDQHYAASRRDLPKCDQGLQLGAQPFGGLGQDSFLIVTGNDDIKRIGAHRIAAFRVVLLVLLAEGLVKVLVDLFGKLHRGVVAHFLVAVVHGGHLNDDGEIAAGLDRNGEGGDIHI